MRHLLSSFLRTALALIRQALRTPTGDVEHDGWGGHNERMAGWKYRPGSKFRGRRTRR